LELERYWCEEMLEVVEHGMKSHCNSNIYGVGHVKPPFYGDFGLNNHKFNSFMQLSWGYRIIGGKGGQRWRL